MAKKSLDILDDILANIHVCHHGALFCPFVDVDEYKCVECLKGTINFYKRELRVLLKELKKCEQDNSEIN